MRKMLVKQRVFILHVFFALCSHLHSQNLFVPKELYKHQDYVGCYKLLKQSKSSPAVSSLLLKCLDKLDSTEVALRLAQQLIKNSNAVIEFEFFGDVYFKANRIDSALILYQKTAKLKSTQSLQRKIQQVYNFKELSKTQGNITINNIGTDVNKANKQYFPQVKYDTLLLYNDKQYPIAERIKCYHTIEGTVKTITLQLKDSPQDFKDLYIISSSTKSEFVLLNVLHKSVDFYTLKLCKYNHQERTITEVSNLNAQLSKSLSDESSAFISDDGEQIVFSSNRKGGFGGYDIYISKILPNGDFSNPRNIGKSINTNANEEFPTLSPDGKKIFFSSDGHTSIGGYDLFVSDYDSINHEFTHVRNLGMDVNTIGDNFNITINSSGRTAYTSGNYKALETFGDDDIYELTFNDIEANTIVVIGETHQANVSSIEITNKITGDLVGIYKTNTNNGKFVAALEPGKYDMLFFIDDKEFTKPLVVQNLPNLSEIVMDFDFK